MPETSTTGPWRVIDNNGIFEGQNVGPYPFDPLLGEAHSQHGSSQESSVNTVERFLQVHFHTHPAFLLQKVELLKHIVTKQEVILDALPFFESWANN